MDEGSKAFVLGGDCVEFKLVEDNKGLVANGDLGSKKTKGVWLLGFLLGIMGVSNLVEDNKGFVVSPWALAWCGPPGDTSTSGRIGGGLGFCSIMEKDKALGGRLFFGCPCVLLSEDRISSGVHTMYDHGSCIVPGSTVVPGGIEARVSRTIPDGSDSKFFNDAMSDVSCYSGAVHGEARRYGPYAKLHPILLEGLHPF
ncbi:unnamed protein product [Ilex paraguariensis]|uniref:Uncharacterized protein n=1 Tax=Ilex paraguariensis TaxID=185542 RepID=A0ABC8REY3_9AQUA